MDNPKNILIIGATSAIAAATAARFVSQDARFMLLGRDEQKLKSIKSDLLARGAAHADFIACDLSATGEIKERSSLVLNRMPEINLLVLAYGVLGDQTASENDPLKAVAEINSNFTSAAAWLLSFSPHFESQKGGTIAVITSVAGDRGRRSNYIYGSAKAGLSVFTEGLRYRLSPCGVRVVNIKPGFVDSPMTAHLKKNFLFSSPESIAAGIERAVLRKQGTVYLPWFWRPIMFILRAIPSPLFGRLKI
ncbi:MAG: SDR family oxidoreductase [Deltaproteobacteria bacterium]|nr:SDR family oxidoreductase [Deltaproteobacteria bacterium]